MRIIEIENTSNLLPLGYVIPIFREREKLFNLQIVRLSSKIFIQDFINKH